MISGAQQGRRGKLSFSTSSAPDLFSGVLADLPSGSFVRDTKLKPNWNSPDGEVRLWRPCSAHVLNQQGAPLQLINVGYNQQYGCTLDNINWISLPRMVKILERFLFRSACECCARLGRRSKRRT